MLNTELPILYGISSTSKVKQWKIEVITTEEGHGVIRTSHGYINGKIQSNDRIVRKGKNIGKSNETTPVEQAISQAKSKWKSKQDQNYLTTIPTADDIPKKILPMLAMDFHKRGHDITYPAYIQPKLNGVRCLAIKKSDEIIDFQSRGGKSYNETLQHMIEPLNKIMHVGEIFDGEIYVHGWSLQRIVSAVKKINSDTPELQYWLYDIADKTTDLLTRITRLSGIVDDDTNSIIFTPTVSVCSKEKIKIKHDEYIQHEFEGAIIRNLEGYYKFNYRSKDLQKFKEFIDGEFKIIGGVEGEGIEEGCVIFICEQEEGLTFSVRPKGSRDIRKIWFNSIDKFIGKQLTVRYQDRSDDNIPLIPVGLGIRDYE